jgi:hypothetical protein
MSSAPALLSASKIETSSSKSWLNAVALVLLFMVAANQSAVEWMAFRYTPYVAL